MTRKTRELARANSVTMSACALSGTEARLARVHIQLAPLKSKTASDSEPCMLGEAAWVGRYACTRTRGAARGMAALQIQVLVEQGSRAVSDAVTG
jgi:hypothetical protein